MHGVRIPRSLSLMMLCLLLSACSPANSGAGDGGEESPSSTGSSVWVGPSGSGTGGGATAGQGAGSSTGSSTGGSAGLKEEERCTVHENCPSEAPFCSVTGYCFACLENTHCDNGFSCFDGLCLPETCLPGETLCAGSQLNTCAPSGSHWTSFECPGAVAQCVDGACVGCDPGVAQCSGKHDRRICLPDGSALVTETCPDEGICAAGECMACYPGTKRCNGGWAQTCSTSGVWQNTENCDASLGQCSAGTCQSACGQAGKLSNEGCDYWAVDMDNKGPAAASPYAVVVSNLNAYPVSVTVTARANSYADPVVVAEGSIAPDQLEVFELPQQNMGTTGVFWKALRVQTSGPVVAYQFNPLENVDVFSNDASLLLPSNTYGLEYLVVSREEIPGSGLETFRGSMAIVATVADTSVTITPSAPTRGGSGLPAMEAGETRTVLLQPYQVLNVQSDLLGGDLTGTWITSDKPIGVFGGHEAAVSDEQCCADHLEQQLFPVSTWGKTYVASKSRARGIEKDYWRVVASVAGTSVTLSPALADVPNPLVLGKGDFYEFRTDQDFVLTASEPVMVAQTLASSQEIAGPLTCLEDQDCAEGYSCSWVSPECMPDTPYCSLDSDCPDSHTCSCGDLGFCTCEPVGDPALILAVPVEQYRSHYVFLTPTNFMDDYINIVAPVGSTVTLDGTALSPGVFQPVPGGAFQVARLPVSDGVHRIDATAPVGVVAYGYDDDVSYGYPAGLQLAVQP